MSQPACSFCSHDNPEGARFCNECGSPLHLKQCSECESVNEIDAPQCRQCGVLFASSPAEPAHSSALPESPPQAEPFAQPEAPPRETIASSIESADSSDAPVHPAKPEATLAADAHDEDHALASGDAWGHQDGPFVTHGVFEGPGGEIASGAVVDTAILLRLEHTPESLAERFQFDATGTYRAAGANPEPTVPSDDERGPVAALRQMPPKVELFSSYNTLRDERPLRRLAVALTVALMGIGVAAYLGYRYLPGQGQPPNTVVAAAPPQNSDRADEGKAGGDAAPSGRSTAAQTPTNAGDSVQPAPSAPPPSTGAAGASPAAGGVTAPAPAAAAPASSTTLPAAGGTAATAPLTTLPVSGASATSSSAGQTAATSPATASPSTGASVTPPAAGAAASTQPATPAQSSVSPPDLSGSTPPASAQEDRAASPKDKRESADEGAASSGSAAASRKSGSSTQEPKGQESRDAMATNRVIARELGQAAAPGPRPATAAPDKAAAETQRIIDRELGTFAPSSTRVPTPVPR